MLRRAFGILLIQESAIAFLMSETEFLSNQWVTVIGHVQAEDGEKQVS